MFAFEGLLFFLGGCFGFCFFWSSRVEGRWVGADGDEEVGGETTPEGETFRSLVAEGMWEEPLPKKERREGWLREHRKAEGR